MGKGAQNAERAKNNRAVAEDATKRRLTSLRVLAPIGEALGRAVRLEPREAVKHVKDRHAERVGKFVRAPVTQPRSDLRTCVNASMVAPALMSAFMPRDSGLSTEPEYASTRFSWASMASASERHLEGMPHSQTMSMTASVAMAESRSRNARQMSPASGSRRASARAAHSKTSLQAAGDGALQTDPLTTTTSSPASSTVRAASEEQPIDVVVRSANPDLATTSAACAARARPYGVARQAPMTHASGRSKSSEASPAQWNLWPVRAMSNVGWCQA